MATYTHSGQNYSSQRALAMVLAVSSALVLSPLYVTRKDNSTGRFYETKWNSGFVLPMLLAGLIIAIKTTSSQAQQRGGHPMFVPCSDPSLVLRIGSSSWGLAGILVMLLLVLSWQEYVQEFFWR